MSKFKKLSALHHATIGLMVSICCAHPAFAGTQGAYINSAGFGKAVDSVTFNGITRTATSNAMTGPCAAVNPQPSSFCSTGARIALPPGAPSTIFCQSQGAPNYLWSIRSFVTGGAKADNPELEALVDITPADCAEVALESAASFTDANSGQIVVNAMATAGAAMRLRGFQFPNGLTPQSLEDLKLQGLLRFDLVFTGPFEFGGNDTNGGCTSLIIPFRSDTGHKNFYFVADTVAASNPFGVSCPKNVVFECGDPVVYPVPTVTGACGNVTVSYHPPAHALPSGTTVVKATVTDEAGNTAKCSFTANRKTLTFDGFFAPLDCAGGSCNRPGQSFKQDKNSVIPIKFKTKCGGKIYSSGKPTLTVKQCSTGKVISQGQFQWKSSFWHADWNTKKLAKGVYEIIATLQDGSKESVFIKLQ